MLTDDFKLLPDFLQRTILWMTIMALVILTPFSINNFLDQDYLIGAGSLSVIFMLTVNAFSIKRGWYYPVITQLLVISILCFMVFSIQTLGIIGIFWTYPSMIAFYFILPERQAWVASALLLLIVALQGYAVLELSLLTRILSTLFAVGIFSAIFIRIITQHQEIIEKNAITDALTGLYNRKFLNTVLDDAIQQHRRSHLPMSLLALDIDHFKTINDTYGHDAGDKVLQELADILKERLRATDHAFRCGGEEFLVLLYNTELSAANDVAETIRSRVENTVFIPEHSVTISIGVSTLNTQEDRSAWLKRSDEKLYEAKTTGRNRVIH